MRKRLGTGLLAVAAALGLAIGATGTAWADTGSYTSTWGCSNGMGIQGHYIIGQNIIRADGMAGYVGNNGYVRDVLVREQNEGVQMGSRHITYSGTAKSVGFTGVGLDYFPWMSNYGDHRAVIIVNLTTSTGASCNYAWPMD